MFILQRLMTDRAENSIMQTITIAVSAILIAAGLITAPGIINNARDGNARSDLYNLGVAQEQSLALWSGYNDKVDPSVPDTPTAPSLATTSGTKYTISDKVKAKAIICTNGQSGYVMSAQSQTKTVFYKSSSSSQITNNKNNMVVPDCIDRTRLSELEFADGNNPDPGNPESLFAASSALNYSGSNIPSFTMDVLNKLAPAAPPAMEVTTEFDPFGMVDVAVWMVSPSEFKITNNGRTIGTSASTGQTYLYRFSSPEDPTDVMTRYTIPGMEVADMNDIRLVYNGSSQLETPWGAIAIPADPSAAGNVDPSGYDRNARTVTGMIGSMSQSPVSQTFSADITFGFAGMENSTADYYFHHLQTAASKTVNATIYYSASGTEDGYEVIGSVPMGFIVNGENASLTVTPYQGYKNVVSMPGQIYDGKWKIVFDYMGGTYTVYGTPSYSY